MGFIFFLFFVFFFSSHWRANLFFYIYVLLSCECFFFYFFLVFYFKTICTYILKLGPFSFTMVELYATITCETFSLSFFFYLSFSFSPFYLFFFSRGKGGKKERRKGVSRSQASIARIRKQ
ncbi:hypothetical protein GGR50DRAFT_663556 [Xylaria sp. CBS 124048]|nr:hypothetical protein GGR50DRAFT_663556 [Xylaria sp. CBS 124048]